MIDQNTVDNVYALLKKQYTLLVKQRDALTRAISVNTDMTLLVYPHITPPKEEYDMPWDSPEWNRVDEIKTKTKRQAVKELQALPWDA